MLIILCIFKLVQIYFFSTSELSAWQTVNVKCVGLHDCTVVSFCHQLYHMSFITCVADVVMLCSGSGVNEVGSTSSSVADYCTRRPHHSHCGWHSTLHAGHSTITVTYLCYCIIIIIIVIEIEWACLGITDPTRKALGQRRPPPSILIRHNIIVPFKAMLTKISKWSRIQDFFRITPKIESLVVFAIPRHSLKISERSFRYFLSYLANTQTDRQTNKLWQKHNLLGRGNKDVLRCWSKAKSGCAVEQQFVLQVQCRLMKHSLVRLEAIACGEIVLAQMFFFPTSRSPRCVGRPAWNFARWLVLGPIL